MRRARIVFTYKLYCYLLLSAIVAVSGTRHCCLLSSAKMAASDLQESLLPSTNDSLDNLPANGLHCEDGADVCLDAEQHSSRAGTPWLLTTAILLGDMFGLGALTIPAAFARLGWSLGFISLAISALGMCYSGVLFARLSGAYPRVTVFDQLGKLAYSRLGQRLVFATIYACIFITPVIFQITCTESLQTMLQAEGKTVGVIAMHAIILGIMLPLAQIRQLEEVGWLSVVGTLCMALALAIALIKILLLPADDLDAHAFAPASNASDSSFRLGLVAFMDVVFAYGGAANWMRYISGMQKRQHFRRVAGLGSAFMSACYIALGAAGYVKMGTDFDLSKPITSVLPYDGWTVVMNAALFIHCIVAYAININVWTDLVLHLFAAQAGHANEEQDSKSHRAAWALVSTVGLSFCFLVAYTFPYFSIVVALISSVGDLAAAYALPALFSLKLLKLPAWERVLCFALVPLALSVSGVGMYSSMHELIAKVLKL